MILYKIYSLLEYSIVNALNIYVNHSAIWFTSKTNRQIHGIFQPESWV